MTFSDDFLKGFGRISVSFQALEMSMALLTWSMIGSNSYVGQIVTSQLSFRRLCDLLTVLFRFRITDAALVEELEDIVRRASDAEGRRNIVVHSVWLVDDEGSSSRLKIKSERKKGLSVDLQDMDAKALHEIADVIERLAEELTQFIRKLHESKIIAAIHTSGL